MLNNIKNGFTLAEVVVVLVVMAVVASILMPTLIANNEQRVMVTALKKNFADLQTLQDAINLEEMHHTRCAKLNNSDEANMMNTLIGTDNTGFRSGGMITQYLKTMNKSAYNNTVYVKKLNTYKGTYDTDTDGNSINKYIVAQKNGTLWIPYRIDENTVRFFVDVNGTKSPNKAGRDIFYFDLNRNTETGKWEVTPYNVGIDTTGAYIKCLNLDACQKGKEKDYKTDCTACAAAIFKD